MHVCVNETLRQMGGERISSGWEQGPREWVWVDWNAKEITLSLSLPIANGINICVKTNQNLKKKTLEVCKKSVCKKERRKKRSSCQSECVAHIQWPCKIIKRSQMFFNTPPHTYHFTPWFVGNSWTCTQNKKRCDQRYRFHRPPTGEESRRTWLKNLKTSQEIPHPYFWLG